MKYLELDALESVNHLLSQLESSDSGNILGRLEAYSCKPAGIDKKLYKEMISMIGTNQNHIILSSSPERNQQYTEDEDEEIKSKSRNTPERVSSEHKILYYLIATLNQSFPDYDFRDLGMEHFVSVESLNDVIEHVQSMLFNACFHHPVITLAELNRMLWDAIDLSIQLGSCDIYSYISDMDGDPFFEGGCIWSFNYFFWNKKQKRILFFYCKCMNTSILDDSSASIVMRSITPSAASQDDDSDNETISLPRKSITSL